MYRQLVADARRDDSAGESFPEANECFLLASRHGETCVGFLDTKFFLKYVFPSLFLSLSQLGSE